MASSDEEGEIVPDCVTNYYLIDYKEEPISFSSLPLQWSEDEAIDGLSTQIFLRGDADSGPQQIYKKVIAWKVDLSYVQPEIYVLSKDKTWIKLQRPRKSFEHVIKTILITVRCLHFVKRNPEASGDDLWNHLLKAFSSYEVEPSKNDLLEHMPLINEAAIRDKDIGKCEHLGTFLLEMLEKRKALHEENRTSKKSKFIVDMEKDDSGSDNADDECEGNEAELFDSVCALCDNGGELLCCEGRCIRSFHPTKVAGAVSFCETLGYTDAQVEAIQTFLCKNCQYEQHQCFVCGNLGSSNKSSGAKVFPCVSATCGHFYHPRCAAKLLHPVDEIQAEELQKKIATRESFLCPAHKCFLCKQVEDKRVHDLQFALCRRCPKAYHRKCLPRTIVCESNAVENIHQRAWDGLLLNRILIYCMDHKIIPEIGTPRRDHIRFPDRDGKNKQCTSGMVSSKEKVVVEKRSLVYGNLTERTAVKMQPKVEWIYGAVKGVDYTKINERKFPRPAYESQINGLIKKSVKENKESKLMEVNKSSTVDTGKASLINFQSDAVLSKRLTLINSKQPNSLICKTKNTVQAKPEMKKASTQPLVNAEMKNRIVTLMKTVTSSFNMEEFIKKKKRPSTHAYSSKFVIDNTITMGKVEGSVKAIRAALKKLEEGCTIEDAKAVCEPEILNQIISWKRKLKVYLAPFLHGMRYTSFGRHFTKMDKLMEIVDRLHWYVQDGDMIVDFCCGSNDFSCLMKEKLGKLGKRCSFKNYDLIQPKNDFNFEQRDWMTVRLEELPAGCKLIMGLNPPFGTHASLANKFIAQALKFKPKLLILIVPKEAKRLDGRKQKPPYNIIWEDGEILSGKHFYLPGSVDVQDQQIEQWNVQPPPLYLWSHPAWTANHKAIAQEHGHVSNELEEKNAKRKIAEISNYLMDTNYDCYDDFSHPMNASGDISNILDDVPEEFYDTEIEGIGLTVLDKQEDKPYTIVGGTQGFDNYNHDNAPSPENRDEVQYADKHEIGQYEISPTGTEDIEEVL